MWECWWRAGVRELAESAAAGSTVSGWPNSLPHAATVARGRKDRFTFFIVT